ncbi:MAG: hypothetical protein IT223_00940 [Crocinitomicaceae bacterium]|nr:hypothetical protein [Crocinitomicaceae bacterium]
MKVTKITRRKYTEQQVREYLQQFESSGMNRSRFAKVNRINYFTFIGWLDKRSRLKGSGDNEKFIPVSIPQSEGVFAEVQMKNGKRLIFHQAPSPQYLAQLLS